jgi:chromosome segregation ATPase
MDRAQVEANLAAIAQKKQAAAERAQRQQELVARLEEERVEAEAQAVLARRAMSDYEEYEARLQEQLAAVEAEEAREALDSAILARDEAAERASAAAAALRSAHEELRKARDGVGAAVRRLRRLDRTAAASVPLESVAFEQRWRQLAPLVEQELDVQLQIVAVAAAAQSGNARDIERLPAHLQPIARERRKELFGESSKRS